MVCGEKVKVKTGKRVERERVEFFFFLCALPSAVVVVVVGGGCRRRVVGRLRIADPPSCKAPGRPNFEQYTAREPRTLHYSPPGAVELGIRAWQAAIRKRRRLRGERRDRAGSSSFCFSLDPLAAAAAAANVAHFAPAFLSRC